MATKMFKKNLNLLLNLFNSQEELIEFLSNKNSFNEKFIKQITESNYLKKLHKIDYNFDIEKIKRKLQYEISYNKNNKKILVDITTNDVFSYLETDEELIKKMKKYIENEEYEKAQVMKKYFNTIELEYYQ
jgi:hypothetical protein